MRRFHVVHEDCWSFLEQLWIGGIGLQIFNYEANASA